MKEKRMITILLAEAAICIFFCILQQIFPGMFTGLFAFPFEQVGASLRALSLSGAVGNVFAIIFYILFSLIPAAIYLLLKKTGRDTKADLFLLPLSVFLFVINYYMINPGLLFTDTLEAGKWSLGITFYSFLLCYLIVQILLKYRNADKKTLERGLQLLLGLLTMVFTYAIAGQELNQLLTSISSLQEENSLTCVFLILHYLVTILPYALDIAVIFYARRLLKALEVNPYLEETAQLAETLGKICVLTLMTSILAEGIFNFLQIIFQSSLVSQNYVISIPVFSLIFVLAMLLFARYVREIQKLKQDNDLFI